MKNVRIEKIDLMKFEEKYKFIERRIFGEKYWDFIRMNFFNDIKSKANKTGFIADFDKKVKFSEIKINLKNLKKYLFYTKRHYDAIFVVDPKRIIQDNKYESQFSDSLSTIVNKKYSVISLEAPNWAELNFNCPTHFFNCTTSNIKYTDFFEIEYLVKKKFFLLFNRRKKREIEKELKVIIDLANKYFNINLFDRLNIYMDIILYVLIMKKRYISIIKKYSPKIAFLQYRPTKFKQLLNYVFKELNIPTVEIQHGVLTGQEIKDYTLIKNYTYLTTSNYFFAFSEKLISYPYYCIDKNNIKYIGYPFLDNKFLRLNKTDQKEKYILIISQSVIGDDFVNFTSKLSDLLEKYDNSIKIVFKYHPNEVSRDYLKLRKNNIIEVKNIDSDIYKLMKGAFLQIGSYSTAIYEGLKFRLPTVIISNLMGACETLNTLSFIKEGIYALDTPEQVIEIIKKGVKKPDLRDINNLWIPVSEEKIIENIEKIFNDKKEGNINERKNTKII